jgi:AraC-like DNA-binding protein
MASIGRISALLVRPIVATLLARGLPLDAFYGATDLTPEILADVEARVSPSQFCIAWSELVRLTGEPRIALAIADALPPGSFGVVEYVCRSAPTLGDALRLWTRYLNLLDDAVKVGLVIEGERASLRVLVESEAPAPASHELCFAVVVAHARAVCGARFRPVSVRFSHRAPSVAPEAVSAYEAWFGAKVVFNADATELVMETSALDAKLATADAGLSSILARVADRELEERRDAPPLTAQVKRALRDALKNDDAQIEGIAKRLGLAARSLQRRLRDEGTTLQALRDEVRRDLGARYLEEDLSVTEISFLLGFSEPSAFFRAWKRWTGQTPLESKEQKRLLLEAG